jgi:hypothetical protein
VKTFDLHGIPAGLRRQREDQLALGSFLSEARAALERHGLTALPVEHVMIVH